MIPDSDSSKDSTVIVIITLIVNAGAYVIQITQSKSGTCISIGAKTIETYAHLVLRVNPRFALAHKEMKCL